MFRYRDESYTSVYAEIKTNLELTNSAEKLQMHCQHFLKILDNLGQPVADVSKSIATQLSTLTGKIYMHISRIGEGVGQILSLSLDTSLIMAHQFGVICKVTSTKQ